MQLNKLSFVLGNIAGSVVVGLVAVACGGSGDGFAIAPQNGAGSSGGASSDAGTIMASNVIVRSGTRTASLKDGVVRVQANQLPDNVQVLASNVALVTVSNDLSSRDLQTALDKEIAVDVAKTIIGVWQVENLGDFFAPSGRVEFKSDGTYTIETGGLGASGMVAADVNSICAPATNTTYTFVDGALAFNGSVTGSNGVVHPGIKGTATIAKSAEDAITLIGDGNCASGKMVISRLTRIGVRPTASKAVPISPSKRVVALANTPH